MLSAVFRTVLPEISTSPVIQDLLRSFKVEAPCRAIRPPAWDLFISHNFLLVSTSLVLYLGLLVRLSSGDWSLSSICYTILV